MTIFIDTGIWVAARNKIDDFHTVATQILETVLAGEYGQVITSDYVFSEAVVLAIVRTKQHAVARDIGEFILEFPQLTLLFTPESIFREAWATHERYNDKPLSFTDCTIIAWSENLKIDYIASFDGSFDGILTRVMS